MQATAKTKKNSSERKKFKRVALGGALTLKFEHTNALS